MPVTFLLKSCALADRLEERLAKSRGQVEKLTPSTLHHLLTV